MRIEFKRLVAILLITPLLGGDIWLYFVDSSRFDCDLDRRSSLMEDAAAPAPASIEMSAGVGSRFIRLEPAEPLLARCLTLDGAPQWHAAELFETQYCLAFETSSCQASHAAPHLHLRI